jgi:hypothetical protein
MDNSYYTILGWTVTLVGGGVAYYYYTKPDGRQREFRGRSARGSLPRTAAVAPPAAEPARRKKQQDKPKPAAPATSEAHPAENGSSKPTVVEREEKEDLSWARELAQKKQGTTLAAPSRAAARHKTVKQANANNRAAELSASSSTSDTDDDESPVVSPALNSNGINPSGRNVSDMLEPAASGPAVLKLTESTNPKKEKKHQAKALQQQETKKQRQNRKKVEEKKAQREADEKERRVLLENQRKTAREARGEPSKNGLGISTAPASSAWRATKAVAAAPVPAASGPLLDTFTNDDTTTTESTAPTSVSASPVQSSEKWWDGATMPSEEEQQRMLLEQDDNAWVTVSTKGKKSKAQTNGAVQPVEVA